MARKPLTFRSAILTTAAVTAGSTAGAFAETVTTQLGYHQPGIGQLATAAATLWILDKLHTLIGPDDPTNIH